MRARKARWEREVCNLAHSIFKQVYKNEYSKPFQKFERQQVK